MVLFRLIAALQCRLCSLVVLILLTAGVMSAPDAQAQLLSCTGPTIGSGSGQLGNSSVANGAAGCLDYTITNSTGTTGYIQFQLTYTKISNTRLNVTGIQAGYALTTASGSTESITGISTATGGTPALFAPVGTNAVFGTDAGPGNSNPTTSPQATNLSYRINPVSGAISCVGDDCPDEGEEIWFTSANNQRVYIRNFNTTGASGAIIGSFDDDNDVRVYPVGNPNGGQTNFACGGTDSTSCRYGLTASFGKPIGAIPEIDGGKAPQVVLLLSGLYLVLRRRRAKESSPL